jgi:threonine dehydrogenase-like Zn-dependent dehydrogenase
MPEWLVKILAFFYVRIPAKYRPPIKKIFYWFLIRVESLFSFRKIFKGKRITFIDFEIADLEVFEFLGPDKNEVLVESNCSTVSPGTENAVLCGLPGARRFFPYYPGYSTAGIIRKIGKNVQDFSIGDRVAGRIHHVSHETVNPDNLFKIPSGVSDLEASFIELGIITLQGIRKADIKPGDIVAVVGQGLIGQLANILVRVVGASEIIAVASSGNRKKTALSEGGADTFIALSEKVQNIDELGADVVIEAVGSPHAIETSLRCAKKGGKIVLLGSSRGLGRNVEWHTLAQSRNLMVIGAHISALPMNDASPNRWIYKEEGKLFLELLEKNKISVSNLVTWQATPEESNAVYEALSEGGKNHVGIVFNWKQN